MGECRGGVTHANNLHNITVFGGITVIPAEPSEALRLFYRAPIDSKMSEITRTRNCCILYNHCCLTYALSHFWDKTYSYL